MNGKNGWVCERMGGCIDRWTDRGVSELQEWMDGWVIGWMGRHTTFRSIFIFMCIGHHEFRHTFTSNSHPWHFF